MDDGGIDIIVQALPNYHELSPPEQAVYQMDQLQYAQALSDPHWNLRERVQKTIVLLVAILESFLNGIVTDNDKLCEAFQYRICN